jgi:hypothetical protein
VSAFSIQATIDFDRGDTGWKIIARVGPGSVAAHGCVEDENVGEVLRLIADEIKQAVAEEFVLLSLG